MSKTDYENKINSKSYRFFDMVYRLLVINIITIVLSITVIGLYPGFVAGYATLNEGFTGDNLFKQYFKNLLKYLKKSIFIGLILLVLYAVIFYAIYFYYKAEVIDEGAKITSLFINAGFLVDLFGFFIVTLLSCHLPLLMITFEKLTIGELFRTSLFVTFRYFISTLIILICHIVIIGGFFVCIFIDPRILAIWMLIGISLPVLLACKFTSVVYYKFKQIDLESIMHIDYEEEDDE